MLLLLERIREDCLCLYQYLRYYCSIDYYTRWKFTIWIGSPFNFMDNQFYRIFHYFLSLKYLQITATLCLHDFKILLCNIHFYYIFHYLVLSFPCSCRSWKSIAWRYSRNRCYIYCLIIGISINFLWFVSQYTAQENCSE